MTQLGLKGDMTSRGVLLVAFKIPKCTSHLGIGLVGVKWTKTVDLHEAVKEIGFFGNQNTVARPRAHSWHFTVERLKTLWQMS